MLERIKMAALRTWIRLKDEERGAQTLEWLALALLILAILGGTAAASGSLGIANELRQKFLDMINKIQ